MEDDNNFLIERLSALQQEHRDLDAAVAALEETGSSDMLQIKRLKKRKLQLKDEIRILSARVLPDIIA
ncbi:YdcH family protein [Acuticoccus mangrovi]|uniref:DUF465 domain-containing protein n=1 Tax=Acuticoccus mangrovi TaxID=2796142 RepID=A0A934ITN8_9HYPH|nr:DUF465 domain-containing protein [Acuticoccus mangrovi]MBJ3778626.1 DUF465 domain-containing protein [Acuticoccus mangrovi]